MTESTGGSDVGRSETVAVKDDAGTWRLHGRKWFTSAATSQMALTLARPEGNGPGGSGLALFYVETRDEDGRLRQHPDRTAQGQARHAQGADGRAHARRHAGGARRRAERTGSATSRRCSTSRARGTRSRAPPACARGLALARDYAKKRIAFGTPLAEKPLHVDTLAGIAAEHEGALQLAFFVAELLGRHEAGELDEHHARLLRLLTPIAKLTTAKQAVAAASEVLECFGGAGYVEDTGLPVLLRDAQVLPIWEGTTNVLSLDTLRALAKDPGVLGALRDEIGRAAEEARDAGLAAVARSAVLAVDHASAWLERTAASSPELLEAGARRFALTLGRGIEVALVVRQAEWSLEHGGDRRPLAAAHRLAAGGIDLVLDDPPPDGHLLAGL